MGRFLIKISLFTILLIGINFCYLLAVQALDFNFKKRIQAMNLENPSFELLAVGNSLAMDGIDTELLSQNGFSAYNLSIGGSSLKTNYIQLDEYFENYLKKPNYVVLGLGAYRNSFTKEEIHPVIDFTRKDKTYGWSDIPILKFKWMFKEMLKKIVSKDHRSAHLKRGQLRFSKVRKDNSKIDSTQRFNIEKYKTSTQIKEILNLCNERRIKLIILEMPGAKFTRHPIQFESTFLDTKNRNGLLLDFNYIKFGETIDDEKDWIGNGHLNEVGAKKFTNQLLKDLKKIDLQPELFFTANN